MAAQGIRRFVAIGALSIGIALWAVGCEQQEGDRCQSTEDCASGLECNLATLTCSDEDSSNPIDASVADGPPPDAAIDAMIDAP